MKIESSKELLGEIKKNMFINGYTNEDLAQKRNVTKQTISSFFKSNNPRFNSILETVDALDAELYIEIKNKDEK